MSNGVNQEHGKSRSVETSVGGPSSEICFGAVKVPVWPAGVRFIHLDPMLCIVHFPDNDIIRKIAKPKLLEAAAQFRANNPDRWIGGGGAKVRDIADWPCRAMGLLHERAREAFRRLTNSKQAFIDDTWASVYDKGEYIGPHSHRRTEVSIVYHMTPPDEADREQFNGALGIVDPRVKRCCPTAPGIVTSQVYPPLDPGTMVLFPSFVAHYVTPHQGEKPRISIAWNIASEEIDGNVADEPLF